jgi:HD superfamily phosphohydrolase
MNAFSERIGLFLQKNLSECKPENRGNKAIHDPLWGSNLFYPWEVALIDTPIVQRLRRIHQTGTAFFTYPSSSHSRFTHSLGVIILADRLLRQLKETHGEELVSNKDIYEVRLAGLLHDVGHCFFSHTSEQVFMHLKEFNDLRSQVPIFKQKTMPHEIFAYLILTNQVFLDFWEQIKEMFKKPEDAPDISNVAKMIIDADVPPEKRFLKEIISGPYDVDKLEYLYRDGYNAGLNIAYDIERYFYRIAVADTSASSGVPNEIRLVMDLAGVTAVEQLIFSKMMLFSYIYHHQKVRSADCLIRDIALEMLMQDDLPVKIDHPSDFLNYSDFDMLSCFVSEGDLYLNNLLRRLQNRDLLKRCFVISRDFVIGLRFDQNTSAAYERLCGDMRDVINGQRKLRERILDKINKRSATKYSIDDVYVDLPEIPSIEEAAKAPVKLPDGRIEAMSDYFQLEGWQKIYEIKKLRGYFFVRSEIVDLANEIIQELLRDEYNLTFSSLSSQLAKVVSA